MNFNQIKMTLKIAWRNVIRNRRRSILTLIGIMIGVESIIVFGGYIYANYEAIRESTIHSRLGHIQIMRKDYLKLGKLDPQQYSVSNIVKYETIKKELMKIDDIEVITKRAEFSGLLSNGDNTVPFLATAVEPDIDSKINTFIFYIDGKPISSQAPLGIGIGKGLASLLNIKANSDLTIMSNYGTMGLGAVDIKVRGVFRSGVKVYDDIAITTPFPAVNSLIGDGQIHKIVIILKKTEQTQIVKGKIEKLLKEKGWDLKVYTWKDLALFYQKVVQLYDSFFIFVSFVVILVVIFTIANTITMSVFERVREIGSIRAIGAKKKNILYLFLAEGVYIGFIGGILGVIFGVLTSIIITHLGFMQPPPPGYTIEVPIYILIVPKVLVFAFLVAQITSIFSALFPAFKATKFKIVDAMRYV